MEMKTIEQKAKAYDEAIKRVENIKTGKCETTFMFTEGLFEYVFPELKESEDEKIRKELISHFVGLRDNISKEWYGIKVKDIIAWLEKQGESKFEQCIQEGDKIVTNEDGTHFNVSQLERVVKKEPKFKVGDYLVNDYCKGKVIALTDDAYLLDTEQGIPFSCEHNAHLWTIRDAKDGDVLAWNDSKCIALFKNIYNEDHFNSYGFVGHYTGVFEFIQGYHCIKDAHPSTKEQRDLLFQKMKEAGYEWDAEKKILRRFIRQIKPNDDNALSTWSEEDERMCQETIDWFEKKCFPYALPEENPAKYSIIWLKTLKERMKGE